MHSQVCSQACSRRVSLAGNLRHSRVRNPQASHLAVPVANRAEIQHGSPAHSHLVSLAPNLRDSPVRNQAVSHLVSPHVILVYSQANHRAIPLNLQANLAFSRQVSRAASPRHFLVVVEGLAHAPRATIGA